MKSTSTDHVRDGLEYRLIYVVCFTLCFVAACISRLLPRRYRSEADHPLGTKSIYGEAKLAASNSVPFAFM